jgi:hypothetical protein
MRTLHHGWLIDLIPEPNGYSFYCWDSQQGIAISDSRVYPSLQKTLASARHRADLESVNLALTGFLNEICGNCYYLTAEDHTALISSIAEFIQSATQTC